MSEGEAEQPELSFIGGSGSVGSERTFRIHSVDNECVLATT